MDIYIDSRFGKIFMMVPGKSLAVLSVMTIADVLEVPLVWEKLPDKDSMKKSLGLQLGQII